MKSTRLIVLTLAIVLVVVGSLFQTARSQGNSVCLVCSGNESLNGWYPQYPSVNATLDYQDKQEGSAALKVVISNETRAVGVAYVLASPTRFENNSTLVLWVKVQNITTVRSLYLSIGDSNSNWRQFGDFSEWFALESSTWTRVAIDVSHFASQDQSFDLSSVRQIWFGSFAGGSLYDQAFSIDDVTFTSVGQIPEPSVPLTSLLPIWWAACLILFLYLMAFPMGFLVWRLLGLSSSREDRSSIYLPLQLALGIVLDAIVFLVATLVSINTFLVWAVWFSPAFVLLVISRRTIHWSSHPILSSRNFIARQNVGSIGVLPAIGFSVFIMARVSAQLGWAPPNDSFIHSIIVSLILFNGHLGSSFSPISQIPLNTFGYSRGFYGLPVSISLVSGTYPGQSTMLVGAAIVALLPSILYSVTFLKTRSTVWAIVSFLFAFFLPAMVVVDAWVPSNDLLLGAFLVATYPSLMGNFLLLTMFAIVLLYDDFGPVSLRSSKWIWAFLLLTVSMSVTYYPYLLYPFLYLPIRIGLSTDWRRVASKVGTIKLFSLVAFGSIITSYAFLVLRTYAITALSLNTDVQFQLGQAINPLGQGRQYYVYGALVAATLGLAIRARFRGISLSLRMKSAELFFVVMLASHIASLASETVHNWLLWTTNPSRSLIVLYALTYVMLPTYASHLKPIGFQTTQTPNSASKRIGNLGMRRFGVFVLLLLAFSPSIVAEITYSPSPSRPDMLQVPHNGDYLVSQWASSNIGPSKLILNDLSLSGLSMTSFRAFHVVNDMQRLEEMYIFHTLSDGEISYILDADRILQHPGDYQMVLQTMRRHNITYIYISNASRTIGLFGSGVRFAPPITWTMSQSELLTVYFDNPYLQQAYRSGNAVIFELKAQS